MEDFLTTLGTIFLAGMGDKTQLAAILMKGAAIAFILVGIWMFLGK